MKIKRWEKDLSNYPNLLMYSRFYNGKYPELDELQAELETEKVFLESQRDELETVEEIKDIIRRRPDVFLPFHLQREAKEKTMADLLASIEERIVQTYMDSRYHYKFLQRCIKEFHQLQLVDKDR